MPKLLEITSSTYLRRLARAINSQPHDQPVHVTFSTGEVRRAVSARFAGGMLQVKIADSAMWFPVYSAEQIAGVTVRRKSR